MTVAPVCRRNTRNPPSKIDFTLLYVPTHARATPYFVGIFTAYIYRCTKAHKPDFRFTYPTMRLCALFFTAQLWMMTIFYFFVTEYNVWTSVAYALTFRLIFATFVATFILISTINTSFRGTCRRVDCDILRSFFFYKLFASAALPYARDRIEWDSDYG